MRNGSINQIFFLHGGGISSSETVLSAKQVTQAGESQTTVPKRDTFTKLLLARTNAEDGLVIELSRDANEDSQWNLKKATWRGQNWNSRWTQYSDDTNWEYTFTNRTPYERNTGCWDFARYWGNNKVCEAFGRVKQGYETTWKNNFPKIKFEGWTTRFRGNGFSASSALDKLSNCSLSVKENKSKDNTIVTVTIACQDGWLDKRLNSSDFERIALDRH